MNFKFCPNCGRKDSVEQQNLTDYQCTKCSWHYWNNPKATASVVFISKDRQILLAKRAIQPSKGLYDIPGGFLEYGENTYDAAKREILEESGVRVSQLRLLGVYANEYLPGETSTCDVIFVATEWEGEFVAADDVEAFEWKPVEFLNSKQFAWPEPGLFNDLKAFIATMDK